MDIDVDGKIAALDTWVLSDGKKGHLNQSLGVAESLGISNPKVIELEKRPLGKLLSFIHPTLSVKNPPKDNWPDLVIATGSLTANISRWIKVSNPSTFVVQMMYPNSGLDVFDVVASPLHDRPTLQNNIVTTVGAPNRITDNILAEAKEKWSKLGKYPSPKIAVMVGGKSRKFSFTPAQAQEFAQEVLHYAKKKDASLFVSPSRRTGDEQTEILRKAFLDYDGEVYFWEGQGDNPYFGFLAWADEAVITADSVSMVSEACSAGLPVYVYGLDTWKLGKFKFFYDALAFQGRIKPFGGLTMDAPEHPLSDTGKVVGFIRGRLMQRFIDELPNVRPVE